jgi:membrane protease YdiL (CAAX protease family)
MQLVDHIFILLIFAVQPIYGSIDTRRYVARIKAGQPANQVRFYVETSIMEWVFMAALGIAWWILGRPITDLGFKNLEGPELWGDTAVLVVIIGLLVYSWQSMKRASKEERKKLTDRLGPLVHFLPHTRRDLRYFFGASITAGIVEEIVYRGFALWYMGSFMPLWVAVAVSSVGFGLVHSYQGASGAVRAGLLGLGLAIFYVLTGSIWLPILAHIAIDMLQGLMLVELLRKDDDAAAEPVSG